MAQRMAARQLASSSMGGLGKTMRVPTGSSSRRISVSEKSMRGGDRFSWMTTCESSS